MNFSSLTKMATNLLLSDLKIDLGKINFDYDKTTRVLIKEKKIIDVRIFTKEKIVFCGGKFVKDFVNKKFPKIKIELNFNDGDEVKKNSDLILFNLVKYLFFILPYFWCGLTFRICGPMILKLF